MRWEVLNCLGNGSETTGAESGTHQILTCVYGMTKKSVYGGFHHSVSKAEMRNRELVVHAVDDCTISEEEVVRVPPTP